MSSPFYLKSMVLESKDCRFTRLKALSLIAVGLITPDNLTRKAGDLLAEIWGTQSPKPLLVDCTGVIGLSNYALEGIVKISDRASTPLVFFNASDHLLSDILVALNQQNARQGIPKTEAVSGRKKVIIYKPVNCGNTKPLKTLILAAETTDQDNIKSILRDSFHKNKNKKLISLHSTPILATGLYNARRIICEPARFIWTLLHLEEKLDSVISVSDWDVSMHCLLSGSLRASTFAAALAFMKTTSRAVEILDHFGPHPVLLEEHNLGPARRGLKYIYIGDFIVGGTELKIASNWAASHGCKIEKALVLGILWEKERYRMPDIDIQSLISLNKLHSDAEFLLEKK